MRKDNWRTGVEGEEYVDRSLGMEWKMKVVKQAQILVLRRVLAPRKEAAAREKRRAKREARERVAASAVAEKKGEART